MDLRVKETARRGKRRAGQQDLLRYYNREGITRQESIRAKCYECNGMGEVGECDLDACPLFPYSPYVTSEQLMTVRA